MRITKKHQLISLACLRSSIVIFLSFFELCGGNEALADGLSFPTWTEIAPDLETKEVSLTGPAFFYSKIFFVRTSLKEFEVRLIRASDFGTNFSDVNTVAQKSRAVLAINANFFDEQKRALGLVITRGILHQKLHLGGKTLNGTFLVGRRNLRIVPRNNFSLEQVVEAVQGGPLLVLNGNTTATSLDGAYSRRAGVCIDEKKRLIFFIVSSGLFGISLPQLQQALTNEDVRCRDALNLDGGGSAQLFLSLNSASLKAQKSQSDPAQLRAETVLIQGEDEVPVFLGLFSVNRPS